MIRVFKIPLPRELLTALDQEERSLLFLFGYAHNQIAMLWKLVVFSSNRIPPDSVEQKISAAQTQMLARLTLGALHEAWNLVEKRFLSKEIGRKYVPLLDDKGRNALEKLKSLMRGSNLLRTLRNDFAFHYPENGDVEAGFKAAVDQDEFSGEWNWYFSDALLNTFFFASDIVILHAMMNATGESDLIQAHTKIMQEISAVHDPMSEFILAFVAALWKARFGETMGAITSSPIIDAPNFEAIWIPFFAEYSNNLSQPLEDDT